MGKRLFYSKHRQSGSGMAEFCLAAVLLLTLGLGTVELAHWMSVRQAVSLALLQAARAGAVTHGNPTRMAERFEQALLPLFASAGSAVQRRQRHLQEVQTKLGAPPWHISVLSPHPAAYLDFDPPASVAAKPSSLVQAAGMQAVGFIYASVSPDTPQLSIDNDYQALQHQRYLAKGWPQGRGPQSGQTIFEANTLTLALIYPHRPLLPSTRALLRMLPGDNTSYADRALQQGYLPLSRQVSIAMQSHPTQWPSLASGKITTGIIGSSEEADESGHGDNKGFCPGCQNGLSGTIPNTDAEEEEPQTPGADPTPWPDTSAPANSPGDSSDAGGITPPSDSSLCGIALCCVD